MNIEPSYTIIEDFTKDGDYEYNDKWILKIDIEKDFDEDLLTKWEYRVTEKDKDECGRYVPDREVLCTIGTNVCKTHFNILKKYMTVISLSEIFKDIKKERKQNGFNE